jgi:hypothetical protein
MLSVHVSKEKQADREQWDSSENPGTHDFLGVPGNYLGLHNEMMKSH